MMNATGMNTSGLTPHDAVQEPFTIFANVLLMLTIILNVTLNPLGLLVLHRASGIQETTKTLMASLTVADLCIGTFAGIPFLTEVMSGRWVLGDFLCTMWGITHPIFFALSASSLLLLTIDRFIAIVHPLRYSYLLTPKRSKATVGLFWVMASAISTILFGIYSKATASEETNYKCWFSDIGPYSFTATIALAIPLGIILVLYVYILKVARRQARRIAAQNQIGNPPQGRNAPQPVSTKSATTVLIITGTLCLCLTPQIINQALTSQGIRGRAGLAITANTTLFSNSWLNVVIYYWRNRELRQALHDLLSTCSHQLPMHH